MAEPNYDLVVIGAGPGGYIAAIRASQLGLKVACVDREKALGGTCLRVGCIPSKALLESSERFHQARHELVVHGVRVPSVQLDLAAMLKRKDDIVQALTRGVDGLFKKHRIARLLGDARIASPTRVVVKNDRAETAVSARRILIATGSHSATLKGVLVDHDRIGTSTDALAYQAVPEHLVVIGAGYIGLELGSVWSRLGARVTVLEYLDRILPGMDDELAADAHKMLAKQGLQFRLHSRVTGARGTKSGCVVECEGQAPIECDRVLLAVGRTPNTDGLDLEAIGVAKDERGRVLVDDHFTTTVDGVHAIGDVIRGPMLAHKAEEEGVACVEGIVTGHGHVNYDAIPGVVYTWPEIASVGKTEQELEQQGIPFKRGTFPFVANARARTLNSTEGKIKVLAHAHTDRVLGVHILGPRAGDLIAEAGAAIAFGASAEDLARTCHAHPTLAEALKEAALAVDGRPLNA
ncbi:MAG: dihydrolipoyl dehydrogenase [Planctomycetota bacterium]